ncbi:MAG TPA: hypothetical protein VM659_12145 [Dongiaceae bacterium]|nr:hypothetical protein [Dongiaceae bacterium]
MLITRPAKRENIGLLDRHMRFEICEGEQPRGGLVFDPRQRSGAITIGSETFVAARLSPKPDEVMYQALFRLMSGAPKRPANPFALKDAGEQVLALAERHGESFVVTRGAENYALRKPGIFKRLFELYPEGNTQSLGTVGQAKLFTRRLQMDLPASLPAAFQVFLLTLILDLTLQSMKNLSN